jgi:polyisoprenoid-binding protein YceI
MNKIKLVVAAAFSLAVFNSQAQTKYFTKTGKIVFHSETSVENIDATNDRVTSVLEVESGKIEFAAAITAFEFEKALMQEHFNENFMESTKFPKATFKGVITDMNTVDLKKDGSYPVTVKGDMTIHGVTKNITEKATITVKGGKISASANMDVKCKDYNIKGHSKVAETINVKINIANYEPLKK